MKVNRRKRIKYRVRKKISGTPELPRLSVYRSNLEVYCQLIDDVNGVTLAHASSIEDTIPSDISKIEKSKEVGKLMAERVKKLGMEQVVFDRGGYRYHGRVKALADGAREGGLNF